MKISGILCVSVVLFAVSAENVSKASPRATKAADGRPPSSSEGLQKGQKSSKPANIRKPVSGEINDQSTARQSHNSRCNICSSVRQSNRSNFIKDLSKALSKTIKVLGRPRKSLFGKKSSQSNSKRKNTQIHFESLLPSHLTDLNSKLNLSEFREVLIYLSSALNHVKRQKLNGSLTQHKRQAQLVGNLVRKDTNYGTCLLVEFIDRQTPQADRNCNGTVLESIDRLFTVYPKQPADETYKDAVAVEVLDATEKLLKSLDQHLKRDQKTQQKAPKPKKTSPK